jgi:hypothetical protein
MRAMVSDALPGETPETKRTVLVGNCCAMTNPEKAIPITNAKNLISILLL